MPGAVSFPIEHNPWQGFSYKVRFLAVGSARFLVSCAKNCVKIVIGRKTYFDPRVVFFIVYVRQLIARRPIRKITCDGFTEEGAGSQALMIMNAISFARACGLTYVHTPFKAIGHADRPMREWVTAWENLFNLGEGELTIGPKDSDAVNFAYNFSDLMRHFGIHDLDQMLIRMASEFRRKYYENKAPRINDLPVIAVHVRRGDVRRNDPRWIRMEAFVKVTSQAKAILENKGMNCRVRVFSNGDESEFSAFRELGAELFLHADAIWSMQELVESDVLIMATESCFSRVAALLSDGIKIGIKIHEPCGYASLDYWVTCDSNGDFDARQLERQLDELIRSNRLRKGVPRAS